MTYTKEDIMLGLRVIALEDLIRQIAPQIRHDDELVAIGQINRYKCKPNCPKCQIEAVIKSSSRTPKKQVSKQGKRG